MSSRWRLGIIFAALILAGGIAIAWIAVGPSGPKLPLGTLADVPLSGGTGRLDYESLDDSANRLYIAHLGANSVIAFDTLRNRVVATCAASTGEAVYVRVKMYAAFFWPAQNSVRHPFWTGRPYRIRSLERILAHITGRPDVWFATGSELADWYYEHYYDGALRAALFPVLR